MAVAFKLYELSASIEQVLTMMEEGAEGLEDTLDALDMAFEDKVESIIKLWRLKVSQRDAIKAEIYRLNERMNKYDREAQWLQAYVEREMKRAGKERINTPLFTIALQNNPPSVNVIDESAVPEEFWREKVERSIDKKAVLELLKDGQLVPGVEIRQEKSLRVR